MNFENTYNKLPEHFFSRHEPAKFSKPKLLAFNTSLAKELGFDFTKYSDNELALIFSGQKLLEGSEPIAQAYAAHQFGHFVPQLGDGRALLLGEVKGFDIQLKGSGQTAYSRRGDGLSALGPVIREYVVSEAMTALGVPSTRALAAVETGDTVFRETPLPGGVFTRVAASHIRIGTFQFFASREDDEGVKTLLDYSIKRHYPEAKNATDFLRLIIERQINLVTQWMSLGFIHGVMNTDNMTISGETIDFGPCAFMDKFSFNKTFSSIDKQGRYAYSNQGPILAWNMARLAECLIPFVDDNDEKALEILKPIIESIEERFTYKLKERMSAKLGLTIADTDFVNEFLAHLEKEQLDFTLSFRNLGDGSLGEIEEAWKKRLEENGRNISEVIEELKFINPLYIPRNHQVEKAIQGAQDGDLTVFKELNEVLQKPFTYQENLDHYKAEPEEHEIVCATFCGT